MDVLHTVTPAGGRPFHVRLVATGERYGLDDCLVHDRAIPMVEFYDASQDLVKFGPRGQFVSRYYLTTLLDVKGGLDLHCGEPAWQLDAAALASALRWVGEQATRKVAGVPDRVRR